MTDDLVDLEIPSPEADERGQPVVHPDGEHRLGVAQAVAEGLVELDQPVQGTGQVLALEAFEPHVPWEEDFLKLRADCYQQLNHPKAAAARRDLAAFQANEPPPLFNPETEPNPPANTGGK